MQSLELLRLASILFNLESQFVILMQRVDGLERLLKTFAITSTPIAVGTSRVVPLWSLPR